MYYVILSNNQEVPVKGLQQAISLQRSEIHKAEAWNAVAERNNKKSRWILLNFMPYRFTVEMEEVLELLLAVRANEEEIRRIARIQKEIRKEVAYIRQARVVRGYR